MVHFNKLYLVKAKNVGLCFGAGVVKGKLEKRCNVNICNSYVVGVTIGFVHQVAVLCLGGAQSEYCRGYLSFCLRF